MNKSSKQNNNVTGAILIVGYIAILLLTFINSDLIAFKFQISLCILLLIISLGYIYRTGRKLIEFESLLKEQSKKLDYQNENLNTNLKNEKEKNFNFINDSFHDLRNPLTYVKMAIDVISNQAIGPITDQQKSVLSKAEEQILRLNRMINDMLLYSKLTANKINMTFNDCNINEILTKTVETNRKIAEQFSINLKLKLDLEIPNFKADKERLMETINSLILNGLNIMDKGDLSVTSTLDESKDMIILEVEDQGDNIDERLLKDIFEPFKLLTEYSKEGYEKSGLELTIAKIITEKHAGSIEIKPNKNKPGNLIKITLPLNK